MTQPSQPSHPACANCAAPTTDQAWLCHPCTGKLGGDLNAVPDALAQLDVTLTRQDVITTGGKGNGDKPLPINLTASAAAGQIHTVLHGWARCLLEEGDYGDTDWAVAGRDTAGWLAGWLADHLDDIRCQEWAGELAGELRRALDAADICIDRHEERLYAGPCGNPDSDPACAAILWAAIEATEVTCRTCRHVWDVEQRRDQLIAAAKDEWLEIQAVASLVTLVTRERVTAAAITALTTAGRVRSRQESPIFGGPDLYRVRDVLDNLKHRHDDQPATTAELVTWLRDLHDIDLGPSGQGRIRQWAVRKHTEIIKVGADAKGRTLYDRASVLAVAKRLTEEASLRVAS